MQKLDISSIAGPIANSAVNFAHRNSIPGPSGQWRNSIKTMLSWPIINYLLRNLITYIHPFLITSWGRVNLEKPTSSQIVKNFPAFYENRQFIAAVKTARELSLNYIII